MDWFSSQVLNNFVSSSLSKADVLTEAEYERIWMPKYSCSNSVHPLTEDLGAKCISVEPILPGPICKVDLYLPRSTGTWSVELRLRPLATQAYCQRCASVVHEPSARKTMVQSVLNS